MSNEITKDMPNGHSFEERVFASLGLIDTRLQSIDVRLESVEVQAERRALETKPIWERALAEIIGVKAELAEMKERLGSLEDLARQTLRKIDVLNKDMLTMRADQLGLESRIEKIEPSNIL